MVSSDVFRNIPILGDMFVFYWCFNLAGKYTYQLTKAPWQDLWGLLIGSTMFRSSISAIQRIQRSRILGGKSWMMTRGDGFKYTWWFKPWPFWDGDLWPFQGVKWPPTRGWKGHFESPGMFIFIPMWGNDPIWRAYFFRWRWNHQLDDVRKNDADFIDDKPSQTGYRNNIDGWCVNKHGLI